jgi:hypothetical protein
VNREATINNDEVIAMDYITAIELFRFREQRMKSSVINFHSQKEDIETQFAAELASINTAAKEMGFIPKPYQVVEGQNEASGSSVVKKKKKKSALYY